MGHSLKTGAAVLVIVGLVMSGLTVAHAVDEPATAETDQRGAKEVIQEALAPLVEDGTLTREQAEAVAGELVPTVARVRFQDRTGAIVKQLGRLAVETAEVLGITPDDLGEQLKQGTTLAEITAADGTSGEQLVMAVTDHVAAHLAVQMTVGKLDQARADEIVAKTAHTLSDLIDVEHPFRTVLRERRNRARRAATLIAAADALGLSIDDLRVKLDDGSSLAAIAETRGVDEDELIDALLPPITKQIEQAAERGRLTEEAATEALEKGIERVREAIHRVPGHNLGWNQPTGDEG